MRKLLIPLLAAITLPTAVKAESYWLVLYVKAGHGSTLEKIEMESIDMCEEQGTFFLQKKKGGANQYFCLKGK